MRARREDFKAYREGRIAASFAMNPYGPPPNYTNADWSFGAMRANRFWQAGFKAQRLNASKGEG